MPPFVRPDTAPSTTTVEHVVRVYSRNEQSGCWRAHSVISVVFAATTTGTPSAGRFYPVRVWPLFGVQRQICRCFVSGAARLGGQYPRRGCLLAAVQQVRDSAVNTGPAELKSSLGSYGRPRRVRAPGFAESRSGHSANHGRIQRLPLAYEHVRIHERVPMVGNHERRVPILDSRSNHWACRPSTGGGPPFAQPERLTFYQWQPQEARSTSSAGKILV
jgi:hypothetical protein